MKNQEVFIGISLSYLTWCQRYWFRYSLLMGVFYFTQS